MCEIGSKAIISIVSAIAMQPAIDASALANHLQVLLEAGHHSDDESRLLRDVADAVDAIHVLRLEERSGSARG